MLTREERNALRKRYQPIGTKGQSMFCTTERGGQMIKPGDIMLRRDSVVHSITALLSHADEADKVIAALEASLSEIAAQTRDASAWASVAGLAQSVHDVATEPMAVRMERSAALDAAGSVL
jgi:hypothetical protein